MDRSVQFASDNNAGICPEAFAALAEANRGHAPAYGADALTERACDAIRALFDVDAPVYLVMGGTAANALSLASICRSTDAMVCHALAHCNVDECGAPEFFTGGAKLLAIDAPDGKLLPGAVAARSAMPSDEHGSRPRALSLTQATELGTVYTPAELRALAEVARGRGLAVQMDGARFANAVEALGCHPGEIAQRAGVDVLSLGGVKNGLPFGEAIVFFDAALADGFARRRMQGGHLAAKMRFLAAPWLALLESGAWLRHAAHANRMARRLSLAIAPLPGVRLLAPTEANAVFADLPQHAIESLRGRGWRFYAFVGATGCRFMCAWDTTAEAVDALVADLSAILSARVQTSAPPAGPIARSLRNEDKR